MQILVLRAGKPLDWLGLVLHVYMLLLREVYTQLYCVYTTMPNRTGAVRYGKTDVCKQRFIAPYRTDLSEYARRRWSGAVRYGTLRQNFRV